MNPLDAVNEWEAEQQAKPGHPQYPLQQEEAAEIARCVECFGSAHDIAVIRNHYNGERDSLYPQWRTHYNTAFAEWLKGQG